MQPFLSLFSHLRALSVWQVLALLPAAVLILSAVAAVVMRNLFHCALSLTLSFVALGVLFMALGAEFIGLVQITVCVGAVAVLIVFAILLTHPEQVKTGVTSFASWHAIQGGLAAYAVLLALLCCIFFSPFARLRPGVQRLNDRSAARLLPLSSYSEISSNRDQESVSAPVAAIGRNLMGPYMVPLQATGVLLTVALVGAALLARGKTTL